MKGRKTGWAAQLMDEDPDFRRFLDRCERLFRKAGIEVVRHDHYGIMVGPNKKVFAWQNLQKRQRRQDFANFHVGFVWPRLG